MLVIVHIYFNVCAQIVPILNFYFSKTAKTANVSSKILMKLLENQKKISEII
jgi:hypothetical protein